MNPSFDYPLYFIFTPQSYSISLSTLDPPLYYVYAWISVYAYPYMCVFNCELCVCVFWYNEVWVVVCMAGHCMLRWIFMKKKIPNRVVCKWKKMWFCSLCVRMELWECMTCDMWGWASVNCEVHVYKMEEFSFILCVLCV